MNTFKLKVLHKIEGRAWNHITKFVNVDVQRKVYFNVEHHVQLVRENAVNSVKSELNGLL